MFLAASSPIVHVAFAGRNDNEPIDYVTVSQRLRNSVKITRTYPGADCNTDHQLLAARIPLRLQGAPRTPAPLCFNLKNMADNAHYQTEVTNRFRELLRHEEERTPEKLGNSIKQAVLKTAKKTIPKRQRPRKSWISEDTEKLIEQRRERKATNQYQVGNREVRRSLRRDKTKQIKDIHGPEYIISLSLRLPLLSQTYTQR